MDAVALAMIEALPVTAPTVGWQNFNSLGSTWSSCAVSTDGTRVYITHGNNGGNVTASGRVIVAADASVIPSLPGASVARQGVAGAWCNGKHYAIGGQNASNQQSAAVEAYTPAGTNGASGVWSTMALLPNNTTYGSAAVVGNFIYFAGGSNSSGTSALLYRYDTTANTWSTLASMPAARTQGAMVAVGSKLYYLGGLNSGSAATNTIYIFDTAAGTWSTSTVTTPVAIARQSATAIGSTIYMAGGDGTLNLRSFNTTGTTWVTASTLATDHGNDSGMVAIGSAIYLVSGSATANVDKLDLGAGTGYTSAVLGVKSLLNPLLAGVASGLPTTPPTDTTGKAVYAQTVQTLRALAAIS